MFRLIQHIINTVTNSLPELTTESKESKTTTDVKSKTPSFNTPEEILQTFKSANLATIKLMLEHLKRTNQSHILESLRDNENNTLLHLAVLHNTPDVVKFIFSNLEKPANRFCRLANDYGKLPLMITDQIENKETRQAMVEILIPITKEYPIKKLSDPIDIDATIAKYPEAITHDELAYNLRIACEAINLCRQITMTSSTHPTLTGTADEKFSVREKIIAMRNEIPKIKSVATIMQDLQAITQIIKKVGVANCHEIAKITFALLSILTDDHSTKIEIVHIKYGDHVFNIIGRNPNSKLSKQKKWGVNTVIVDAWSGEAYPASKLSEKLMNYTKVQFNKDFKLDDTCTRDTVEKSFNILSYFRPDYHELNCLVNAELPGNKNFKTRGFLKNKMQQSIFAMNFIQGEKVPDSINHRGTKRKAENIEDTHGTKSKKCKL